MDIITAHGFTGFLGKGAAPRELECLLAIASGLTSKEAAKDLGVAPGTIEKRLLSLSTKLGVTRRAAMVAEAFKRGLITPALCAVLAAHAVIADQHHEMIRRPSPARRSELVHAARAAEMAWVV